MDPRGIPTFSEGTERKSHVEEDFSQRLHSPVHSSSYSIPGSSVRYVDQPRLGTSVRSVHLYKHTSSYNSYNEPNAPKRLARRSASNTSNVSRLSNGSTKTPTSAQLLHEQARIPQYTSQIPTFTEQNWNATHSTPSTPGCNSTSTSTEEERLTYDRIPPSFSLHKEMDRPDETQPIYHTKTVRHRREKDWRYKFYYFLVLCTGLLICALILMVSIYAGLGSETLTLSVNPSGVAYKLEVPDWVVARPMLIKFAPRTFGEDSGEVIIESVDVPRNVSDMFKATTKLHNTVGHLDQMLLIECDKEPKQSMEMFIPSPELQDGENEYEAFSLFELDNGLKNSNGANLKEFEVLERRFQPDSLLEVDLPVTAFSSSSPTRQGPEKWIAIVILAKLPGIKMNITTKEVDRCISIVCPLLKNDCNRDKNFKKIDSDSTNPEELPNLGVTYVTVGGAQVYGVEGTAVEFFKDTQADLFGVVVRNPTGLRILYYGLKEYSSEFELNVVTPLSEDVPLLGRLPGEEKERAKLLVEVYPPREYLEARNFPKQRVEPCLTTGDVVKRDFTIEVTDIGIMKDDVFDLFWDGSMISPELVEPDKATYKFKEITDSLHGLRLKARRRPGTHVYDKKATFSIKLTNLKFFDTNEFEGIEVIGEQERRGWFDADNDITFRVEITNSQS